MIKAPIQRIMPNPYGALQGLVAINKPKGKTSADAIRIVQRVFKKSPQFSEPLRLEEIARQKESVPQKQKRRGKRGPPDIKMGHGGTLDPMATGVLILGINGGTKHLQHALDDQKSYECVALFGCSTDTYDAEGKVMRRAPYKHITKEAVEEALKAFSGNIMQKPPIYSALHQNGMRLYEYARKGIPLPMEIKARPVTVHSIKMIDFTTDHTWAFPNEELSDEDKVAGEALENMPATTPDGAKVGEKKHSRDEGDSEAPAKKVKSEAITEEDVGSSPNAALAKEIESEIANEVPATSQFHEESKPAAVSIRMTVGSGFYVRSLVYDLGEALGSAAHMVKLVRTHQGGFELGHNVVEWEDLMNEDISAWEDKVVNTLKAWEEVRAGASGPQKPSGRPRPTNKAPPAEEPVTAKEVPAAETRNEAPIDIEVKEATSTA